MSTLEKKLARAEARITILERMIEEKSREVYVAHIEVERKNRWLSHLLKTIPSGLWVFERGGMPELVNDTARNLLGLSEEEASQVGFRDTFPEVDFERLLAVESTERVETALRRPDGTTLPILLVTSVFNAGAGRAKKLVCLGVDRTAHKQLEDRLRLAQKLEAVGQLAAGVAHEVNTPMQFIGDGVRFLKECLTDLGSALEGHSELFTDLRQRGCLTDADEEKLASIEETSDVAFVLVEGPAAVDRTLRGVTRVAEIVRALKAFAHPVDGAYTSTDVNAAIADAVIVARGEYKHCAEVMLDFGDVPPIVCDAGALNQVLLNLIVNATHAIEEGKAGAMGMITIQTRQERDVVCISVSDDGCGIPEAVRPRLFEPFFTTKPVGKGTGQGLALVHTIVEKQHGGQISFDSQVGVGTTFHIRFPLKRAQTRERAA